MYCKYTDVLENDAKLGAVVIFAVPMCLDVHRAHWRNVFGEVLLSNEAYLLWKCLFSCKEIALET
jgi:hypothetical protein